MTALGQQTCEWNDCGRWRTQMWRVVAEVTLVGSAALVLAYQVNKLLTTSILIFKLSLCAKRIALISWNVTYRVTPLALTAVGSQGNTSEHVTYNSHWSIPWESVVPYLAGYRATGSLGWQSFIHICFAWQNILKYIGSVNEMAPSTKCGCQSELTCLLWGLTCRIMIAAASSSHISKIECS